MKRPATPTTRHLATCLLALGLALGGAACGADDERGPYLAGRPDEITFEADWKPATRFVKDANGRLVDADPATGTYTFAGNDAAAVEDLAALAAGDVAVLEDVGLLRIDSVVASGNQVVVQGGPAALADAIQDGHMAWDVGFDFTRPERFLWVEVGDGAPLLLTPDRPTVRVGTTPAPTGSLTWSGNIGGYAVELKLTPAGQDVNLRFTVKYTSGTAKLSVLGTGTLRGFRSSGSATIVDGVLDAFELDNEGIEADLTLEFGGVELGTKSGAFKVPAKMIMPFPVGPLPAWVSIGGVVEVTSTLKANTSAIAKAQLKFKGAVGLRRDPSTMTGVAPEARVDSIDLSYKSAESVATLTSGLGILMQFPRTEVGLGLPGTGAEAYATVKNEVIANTTVNYEAAGPYPVITGTCLEVGVNLGVYLGGALKAFGITLKGQEFPVATRVMPVKKSGECK